MSRIETRPLRPALYKHFARSLIRCAWILVTSSDSRRCSVYVQLCVPGILPYPRAPVLLFGIPGRHICIRLKRRARAAFFAHLFPRFFARECGYISFFSLRSFVFPHTSPADLLLLWPLFYTGSFLALLSLGQFIFYFSIRTYTYLPSLPREFLVLLFSGQRQSLKNCTDARPPSARVYVQRGIRRVSGCSFLWCGCGIMMVFVCLHVLWEDVVVRISGCNVNLRKKIH